MLASRMLRALQCAISRFFLMLQGVFLYAVGLFLCYRGLVLMLFGSGDCSNPYPDPWEDPKAESASFALYNPEPPALNSTARVV